VGSASVFEGISDAHLGFRARWGDHVFRLKHNIHHNKHLQNHVNKYGIGDLKFEILETCLPKFAVGLETYWTNMLGTIKNGFNVCLPVPNLMGKDHPAYINLDQDSVVRDYTENLISIHTLAQKYNVSYTPIKRILKSHNIKITNHLSGLNFNDLYEEYITSEHSVETLAQKYKIISTTLARGFKRNNLLTKTQRIERDVFILYDRYLNGDSIKEVLSKEYKINYTSINRLFDKYSLKKFNRNENAKKEEKFRRLSETNPV
jgi:AraC-like DNA-binding protein